MIIIPSVFITEDEEDLGILYTKLLKLNGYDVLAVAKNDKETREKYSCLKENPNLFILNHNKPMLNCLESSKKILKDDPNARILFMSDDDVIRNQVEGDNLAFLMKPFQLSTFLETVQKLIANQDDENEN